MNKDDCVLCNLLDRYAHGEDDIKVIYESDLSLAIHAIKPFAEVHILILSKNHIPSMFDLTERDDALVSDILKAIKLAS